jgi:[1-hydroxy-2-(trimethylamino)ethyl]phosphonate dioxygenase
MVQKIVDLFNEKGHSLYGGEAVTQMEHALQAATYARKNNASDALITASLLHDIGHLLHALPDDAPDFGVDDLHEELAALFLEKYFIKEVVEPAKLHVQAKRYLCFVDAGYYNTLSEPSRQSLALQGGIMNAEEAAEFEKYENYKEAVLLRTWDDLAKDPTMQTDPIEAFAPYIANTLK